MKNISVGPEKIVRFFSSDTDKVIPSLYATGELTGDEHGASYMTGKALGKAICFGRVAIDSIAGK